jgi:hypothetical protein
MRRMTKNHESFNANHQHRIRRLESKDSMQKFNASRMATKGRVSMKSLNCHKPFRLSTFNNLECRKHIQSTK